MVFSPAFTCLPTPYLFTPLQYLPIPRPTPPQPTYVRHLPVPAFFIHYLYRVDRVTGISRFYQHFCGTLPYGFAFPALPFWLYCDAFPLHRFALRRIGYVLHLLPLPHTAQLPACGVPRTPSTRRYSCVVAHCGRLPQLAGRAFVVPPPPSQ